MIFATNRADVTAVFYGTIILSTDAADDAVAVTAAGYRALVIAPGGLAVKTAFTAHTADIRAAADLAVIFAVRRVTTIVSADAADTLFARNRSIVEALIQVKDQAPIYIGAPAHSADIIHKKRITRSTGILDRCPFISISIQPIS